MDWAAALPVLQWQNGHTKGICGTRRTMPGEAGVGTEYAPDADVRAEYIVDGMAPEGGSISEDGTIVRAVGKPSEPGIGNGPRLWSIASDSAQGPPTPVVQPRFPLGGRVGLQHGLAGVRKPEEGGGKMRKSPRTRSEMSRIA
mmetsp:Transcript_2414/g.5149  ORF Transcript_2414/g.5149 Transcript_2414/m.5149 type:complete len:143 (-) Transcript_2414:1096-1524(-)